MKCFEMIVNGIVTEVFYSKETIDNVFIPLLKRWSELYNKNKQRVVIFLAAPPAVGKTTIALFLEHLSEQMDDIHPIQAIGLDGFHYHQNYILSHYVDICGKKVPMKEVKGCPETFDIENIEKKLELIHNHNIKWPIYDRQLHDVVDDAIDVTGDIILLEGNWLLLNEGKWAELKKYCDDCIFIKAKKEMLKDRLINRKMKGGLTKAEALAFYEKSDAKNVERVLDCHNDANIYLFMDYNGNYTM